MTTKDKVKVAQVIINHYHNLKFEHRHLSDHPYCAFITRIYELMPEDYRFIFTNEFGPMHKGEWWREFYSPSNYYRLKSEAIDHFLNCIKNQRVV